MTSDLTRAIVSQIQAIEHLIRSGVAIRNDLTSDDIAQIGRSLHAAWRTAADRYRLASEREHERDAQKLDAYHSAASHDVQIEEVVNDWGEAG